MKKHFDEIDAIKGIGIFNVILQHSIILYPIDLHQYEFWNTIYLFLKAVSMPLFFFISGLCFSYKGNYLEHTKKKIRRLLIPYFTFSLLNLILKIMFPAAVNEKLEVLSYLKQVLLNGEGYWFLYSLFVMQAIFPFIEKYSNNSRRKGAVIVALSLLSVSNISISIFSLTSVIKYAIYFYLGIVLKEYKERIINYSNKYVLITAFILCILIFSLYIKCDYKVLEMLCSLAFIVSIMLIRNKVVIDVFKNIGKYSLQLYCLNGFVLVVSRILICKITSIPFVIVLFNTLFCLIIPYIVIKYILSKSRIIKYLMGDF